MHLLAAIWNGGKAERSAFPRFFSCADSAGFEATALDPAKVFVVDASAAKGDTMTVTVSLSVALTENAKVHWRTSNGLAVVQTNRTRASFTVNTVEDAFDETITVALAARRRTAASSLRQTRP